MESGNPYIEAEFKGPDTKLEVIPAILSDMEFSGFQFYDNRLLGYFPEASFQKEEIEERLQIAFGSGEIQFSFQTYPDKNWNAEWEAAFDPVFIGNELVLRADFHKEYQNYPYRITIAPKMAFGTGHHPTTRLMLEQMLPVDFAGKKVLDYGCGTGVLAILASLKQAKKIIAIDNNPHAVENTLENIRHNNIDNIEVFEQDIDDRSEEEAFDVILANITRNVITRSLEEMALRLKQGSILLLSGFFASDLSIVNEYAIAEGLTLTGSAEEEEWVCATFVKN